MTIREALGSGRAKKPQAGPTTWELNFDQGMAEADCVADRLQKRLSARPGDLIDIVQTAIVGCEVKLMRFDQLSEISWLGPGNTAGDASLFMPACCPAARAKAHHRQSAAQHCSPARR
jgi:hypothetical protein